MKFTADLRMNCATVIAGVSELVSESDAYLAKLVKTHRANLASFTRRDRVEAVSVKAIEFLLHRYGFQIREGLIAPGSSEACPLIRLESLKEDAAVLHQLFALLSRLGAPPQFSRIYGVDVGGFILSWNCKQSCWIALGSPIAAEGSVLTELSALGCVEADPVLANSELMDLWMLCGPRKSEVLNLFERTGELGRDGFE